MLINTDDPTKPGISPRSPDLPGSAKSDPDSNDTLAGSWRAEINGFRNLPPFGTGTPYRQVGRFVNDGHGGLLATFVTSNNGIISNETAAGKYGRGYRDPGQAVRRLSRKRRQPIVHSRVLRWVRSAAGAA